MLDFLFYLFIFPLQQLMEMLLQAGFALTASHGASLILLSLVVNLILLPFIFLADALKLRQEKEFAHIQPLLNHLKVNFPNKRERHCYVHTIYKIYDYHPVTGLVSSLGLLLQLPFFIAAYYLLKDYPAFAGVSFSFIFDLSHPDALLNGLNLLPLVMTAVNIYAIYFFSANSSLSEKIQLWLLAAIFLVLLYNQAAALLIYWTTSNIFSLAKNIAEKYFDAKPLKNRILANSICLQHFFINKFKLDITKSICISMLIFIIAGIHFYTYNSNIFPLDTRALIFLIPGFLLSIVTLILFKCLHPSQARRVFCILLLMAVCILIYRPFILGPASIHLIDGIVAFSSEYMPPFIYGFTLNYLLKILLSLTFFGGAIFLGIIFTNLKYYLLSLSIITIAMVALFFSKPIVKVENLAEKKQRLSMGFTQLALADKFIFKPNIYYLVPDTFTSLKTFDDEFKNPADAFDNRPFYRNLRSIGFVAYENAFSNYEDTYSSMVSTWSMKHHYHKGKEKHSFNLYMKDIFFGKNISQATLIKNGYQTYSNYNCLSLHDNMKCLPLWESFQFVPLVIQQYFGKIIAAKIYSLILLADNKSSSRVYEKLTDYIVDSKLVFPAKSPQFVYIHTQGLQLAGTSLPLNIFAPIVTKDILDTANEILTQDPNAMIIIQSDHGSRTSWYSRGIKPHTAQQVFGILFAIKWPKQCERFRTVKAFTPVNLFRYVFACLQGKQSPEKLAADDSYQYGENLWDLWDSSVKKKVLKKIENNKILSQSIEISP